MNHRILNNDRQYGVDEAIQAESNIENEIIQAHLKAKSEVRIMNKTTNEYSVKNLNSGQFRLDTIGSNELKSIVNGINIDVTEHMRNSDMDMYSPVDRVRNLQAQLALPQQLPSEDDFQKFRKERYLPPADIKRTMGMLMPQAHKQSTLDLTKGLFEKKQKPNIQITSGFDEEPDDSEAQSEIMENSNTMMHTMQNQQGDQNLSPQPRNNDSNFNEGIPDLLPQRIRNIKKQITTKQTHNFHREMQSLPKIQIQISRNDGMGNTFRRRRQTCSPKFMKIDENRNSRHQLLIKHMNHQSKTRFSSPFRNNIQLMTQQPKLKLKVSKTKHGVKPGAVAGLISPKTTKTLTNSQSRGSINRAKVFQIYKNIPVEDNEVISEYPEPSPGRGYLDPRQRSNQFYLQKMSQERNQNMDIQNYMHQQVISEVPLIVHVNQDQAEQLRTGSQLTPKTIKNNVSIPYLHGPTQNGQLIPSLGLRSSQTKIARQSHSRTLLVKFGHTAQSNRSISSNLHDSERMKAKNFNDNSQKSLIYNSSMPKMSFCLTKVDEKFQNQTVDHNALIKLDIKKNKKIDYPVIKTFESNRKSKMMMTNIDFGSAIDYNEASKMQRLRQLNATTYTTQNPTKLSDNMGNFISTAFNTTAFNSLNSTLSNSKWKPNRTKKKEQPEKDEQQNDNKNFKGYYKSLQEQIIRNQNQSKQKKVSPKQNQQLEGVLNVGQVSQQVLDDQISRW